MMNKNIYKHFWSVDLKSCTPFGKLIQNARILNNTIIIPNAKDACSGLQDHKEKRTDMNASDFI